MFDSKVEFLGLADRVDLNQIQEAAARHLGKFRMNTLECVI